MELKDGIYKAKAQAAVLAEAGTGTPEVAVEFVLLHPDLAGQSITWHGFLSEKTFNRTIESLRYCGWKGDDLSDLSGIDANEVSLVVANEEYDGALYPKVRWVNRAGGIAVKNPMAGDKAKSFAAKMRGQIRAFDAAKGAKQASPNGGRQPEPPPVDDDIPF